MRCERLLTSNLSHIRVELKEPMLIGKTLQRAALQIGFQIARPLTTNWRLQMEEWKSIGPDLMLTDGDMTEVRLDDTTVLVARVEGQYYAVQGICPHLNGHLARGELKQHIITCPGHGSQFDLRDGRNVAWIPRLTPLARKLAAALRKPQDLRVYPTRVEGGSIWIQVR